MSWIDNRFEEGLIVTSLDWAINWGRSNSIFPLTFGLACCAIEMMAVGASRLRRYVGATPLGAGMIPAALERNYPKRLLKPGWWHMSLFQQPAHGSTLRREPFLRVQGHVHEGRPT